MTREPFVSRAKAAEFDIQTLAATGSGRGGLACLSETTWELAYNLITFYGLWRSRYYYVDPITGEHLTITDDEYSNVTDIVELAIEELRVTGCDDLTQAVQDIVAQLAASNEKLDALNANLVAIKDAIVAQTPPVDYTSEIDDIEEILDGIGTVLGAAAILA